MVSASLAALSGDNGLKYAIRAAEVWVQQARLVAEALKVM